MIKERFVQRLHERYAERKRQNGGSWKSGEGWKREVASDQVLALVDVLFEELSLDEEDHNEEG